MNARRAAEDPSNQPAGRSPCFVVFQRQTTAQCVDLNDSYEFKETLHHSSFKNLKPVTNSNFFVGRIHWSRFK